MSSYDIACNKYIRNNRAPFHVVKFEGEPNKNEHRMLLEGGGEIVALGMGKPRKFIGYTDAEIPDHKSRKRNWSKCTLQHGLKWKPVLVPGCGQRGVFLLPNGEKFEDTDTSSMRMSGPGKRKAAMSGGGTGTPSKGLLGGRRQRLDAGELEI